MSILDDEPFILVTSKRQKSKNSSRSYLPSRQQFQSKNLLLTVEDDTETFDKAAELRYVPS